jgi:hypothetical protein
VAGALMSVYGALNAIKLLRGRETEETVAYILKDLQRDGVIDSFEYCPPNSPDDYRGVDYWVVYQGARIPIQVKSSHTAAMECFRQNKGKILVINGKSHDCKEYLVGRLPAFVRAAKQWG